MQFEIRSAATGSVCCSSSDPAHLCRSCQREAKSRLLVQARDIIGAADDDAHDGDYDPHGTPPNSYDIAIQKLNRPAKPTYPAPPQSPSFDRAPDPVDSPIYRRQDRRPQPRR